MYQVSRSQYRDHHLYADMLMVFCVLTANHSYELQVVSGFEYPTIYGHRTAHLSVNLKNKSQSSFLLHSPLSFNSNRFYLPCSDAVRRRVKETASTLLAIRHPVSDPRVVKFSPKYKLVFSLLNQDATTGDALLDWDVENLLKGKRCFH